MPQLAMDSPVAQVSERLEEIAQNASRFKSSLADNLHRARRAARRTRQGAEDLIENAAHKVKRHPFDAIGIAAGAGLAIGFLVGWAVKRD